MLYLYVSGIYFASVCDFIIGFWNCSDSVLCFCFSYYCHSKIAIYLKNNMHTKNAQILYAYITKVVTSTFCLLMWFIKVQKDSVFILFLSDGVLQKQKRDG